MSVGFIKNTKEVKELIVPIDFTNAVCYGQTGSGKTSGFILPNIEHRVKNNHGLLIYDFKGNLHQQVKMIAKKQNKLSTVHEIGKDWGKKINLLKDANYKMIDSMFEIQSSTKGDNLDYWTQSSKDLFFAIYKILDNTYKAISSLNKFELRHSRYLSLTDKKEYEPSFKNIYDIVKSFSSLQSWLIRVKCDKEEVSKKLYKDMDAVYDNLTPDDKSNINKYFIERRAASEIYNSLEEYKTIKDDGSQSGKMGVVSVLNTTIINIANNREFNSDEFDIVDALNNKQIVIINVQSIDSGVLNMLNISIYQKLSTKVIYNNNTPISIFIDEAQKVLSSKYIPDVDICRENRFEYLFATQDEELLTVALGEKSAYTLLRNVINQYSFKTTLKGSISDSLEQYEYVDITKNKKYMSISQQYHKSELFEVEVDYQREFEIDKMIDGSQYGSSYILLHNPFSDERTTLVQDEDFQTRECEYILPLDDVFETMLREISIDKESESSRNWEVDYNENEGVVLEGGEDLFEYLEEPTY